MIYATITADAENIGTRYEAVKHRRRNMMIVTAIVAVIALVLVYMKFFNGSFLYLSTGLGSQTVLKVSGQKATKTEMEVLFADARNQYEDLFGEDVWSQTVDGVSFEDYAKNQIKSKLTRVACMNAMADKRGIVLGREDKANATKAAKEYYDGLTQEQISKMGVTVDSLEQRFLSFAVAQEVYDDVTSQSTTEISADQARVISIQYICADTQEAIDQARERLDAGEQFFNVAREYNGDDGYEAECKRGEMEASFEEAAFNLKSAEVSKTISSNGKFYIIKCISDNDKTKTEANKASIQETQKLSAFNEIFEPYEAGLYVEFNNGLWKKHHVSGATQTSVNFEDIFNSYFQ